MQEILEPVGLPVSPGTRLLNENGFTGNVFEFEELITHAEFDRAACRGTSVQLGCLVSLDPHASSTTFTATTYRALTYKGIEMPIVYAEGVANDRLYRILIWFGVVAHTYIQEYTNEPAHDLRVFS